jgi:hypothetical protein
MLGIIVVHLIHIKMYLRDIHVGLEFICDRMEESRVTATVIEGDVTG